MKRSYATDPRAEELLIERTLRPLDDQEHRELEALGAAEDDSFDLAAAAVVLASLPIEPMPQHVADKILAAAPVDFRRTLAGVVAELPRDTLVGVNLADFAPPQALQPEPPLPAPTQGDVIVLADRRAKPERERRSRGVMPWFAAAACLIVAGGGLWWAMRRDGITQPDRATVLASADATKIAWTATADPTAHGASGDVVWSTAQQRGYMRFVGLAPNDPAQFQYQLWIFDKTRDDKFPVDGGVFDVSSTGEVIVPISAKLHVSDATLFAVTVERPGGVVVSKRERIVVTAART